MKRWTTRGRKMSRGSARDSVSRVWDMTFTTTTQRARPYESIVTVDIDTNGANRDGGRG